MKRLLFGLCLCWLFVGERAIAQQPISPEQAKAAVRAFEEDPNLRFEGEPELGQIPGYQGEASPYYKLRSARGDDYRVHAYTGEVVSASYKNGNLPNEPSDGPTGPRSKEDCLQIAQNFARAKYQDFDAMGLTLIRGEWNGYAWVFEFGQKVAHDAFTPNDCEIEVNPVDGRVLRYFGKHVGTVTPRPPQLTADQALERAKQATGIVNVTWSKGATLSADPTGAVRWSFAFGGEDANGEYRGYAVVINAKTGEVEELAPETHSVVPPRLTPPRPRWLIIAIYFLPLVSGLAMMFGIVRWRQRRKHGMR